MDDPPGATSSHIAVLAFKWLILLRNERHKSHALFFEYLRIKIDTEGT